MKRLLTIALCVLATTIGGSTVLAQDNTNKQRKSREELAEAQATHIAKQLALDNATTQKLIKTYCDYQKEVWAIARPSMHGTPGAVSARLEHSQKILNLRKKYYELYRQFLTEEQIERVYILERQAMRRLIRHRAQTHKQKHRQS